MKTWLHPGRSLISIFAACIGLSAAPEELWAQQGSPPSKKSDQWKSLEQSISFTEQQLKKSADDLLWFQVLGDIATVEKIRYTGPPSRIPDNPNPQGNQNEVIIPAYTFLPRKTHLGKMPLLVIVHTEVHGDFNSREWSRLVRELIQQGYAVIAPDYRGSTGYGRDFWHLIDYGGLEVEDVFRARQWMLDHYSKLDPARVGILGWSHGGMITLLNLFQHPKAFAVGYCGMPVTDLETRIHYRGEDFAALLSAPYHIGKSMEEDPTEYRRRSPAWHASQLKTPLLIHGVSNDADVKLVEVEKMVTALTQAKKEFTYKVYTNAPSGHMFNLLDIRPAEESRREIYRFIARYLNPPAGLP
jgi:dipeptidyl aminopeptidase/acylaminoacyl peptidase